MHILITGAAGGIGSAIANKLATGTHVLTLVDIDNVKLETLATTLRSKNIQVNTFAGDLTKSEFIQKIDAFLLDSADKLDVLINNAAVAHALKSFENLTDSEFDFYFDINVKAPFRLTQLALKYMQQQSAGVIINVASRANIYGYINMGIYAATKAAITSFTGTIALENADKGIKAYTVIPGRTNTAMQVALRGEQEATQAQSPEYVGQIMAELIEGKIKIQSGDSILVSFGEYKVMPELLKEEMHMKMN